MDIDRPLVDLDTNTASYGDVNVELRPPQVAVVVHVLVRDWPRTVRYGTLEQAVWGYGKQPLDSLTAVRTLVAYARPAMDRLGFLIECINGLGYRLVTPSQKPATAWGQMRRRGLFKNRETA